ncbi:MAG: hypothetical protein KC502_06145 [Myxococcales bacterium]|nr:hypothetical protein [Myxococcales bacterium]
MTSSPLRPRLTHAAVVCALPMVLSLGWAQLADAQAPTAARSAGASTSPTAAPADEAPTATASAATAVDAPRGITVLTQRQKDIAELKKPFEFPTWYITAGALAALGAGLLAGWRLGSRRQR